MLDNDGGTVSGHFKAASLTIGCGGMAQCCICTPGPRLIDWARAQQVGSCAKLCKVGRPCVGPCLLMKPCEMRLKIPGMASL